MFTQIKTVVGYSVNKTKVTFLYLNRYRDLKLYQFNFMFRGRTSNSSFRVTVNHINEEMGYKRLASMHYVEGGGILLSKTPLNCLVLLYRSSMSSPPWSSGTGGGARRRGFCRRWVRPRDFRFSNLVALGAGGGSNTCNSRIIGWIIYFLARNTFAC